MKGPRGHWLALTCLLGALLAFPGVVEAAPQVLPVASSVYAVQATDYFEFAPGDASSIGTTWYVTSPNGDETIIGRIDVGTCTGRVRFYFDSSSPDGLDGCPPNTWSSGSELVGVPGDGTWTITLVGTGSALGGGIGLYQSSDSATDLVDRPAVTLSVGGKAIHFAAGGSETQYWNQHITGAGQTWTEPSHPGTEADPIDEAPDEDPNNAIFFQDAAESPFTAYTLHFNVTCAAVPTMTINGAWLGGVGTIFSQHFSRDGEFVGTTDLRSIFGTTITTEENEGAAASGTDTETVAYNNVAGTSYQFKVRNSTNEALGVVAFAPPNQCTPTAPGGSVLYVRSIGLGLSVSQAQCAFDSVSVTVAVDETALLTLADLQVTIFNAGNGTELATFDDAQMHTQNAGQVYYFATVLPPGAYMVIAQADIAGIGAVDFYDAVSVNVPRGSCVDSPTDLGPVLLAISSATTTLQGNISFEADSIRALMLAYWVDYNATESANLATILAALNFTQSSLIQFWADYNSTALSDLTTILNAIANHDGNMTTQHALQNVTLNQIYQVVQDLNLTIDCGPFNGTAGCNFYIDNDTIQAIYENLTDHRNHTLELTFMNDFNGLGFDGFLFLLFWIAALLFFSYQSWWFALGFSLPGLLEVLFPTQIPEDFTVWFTFCLLGVVMEIAAHRFSWGSHREKGVRPS